MARAGELTGKGTCLIELGTRIESLVKVVFDSGAKRKKKDDALDLFRSYVAVIKDMARLDAYGHNQVRLKVHEIIQAVKPKSDGVRRKEVKICLKQLRDDLGGKPEKKPETGKTSRID